MYSGMKRAKQKPSLSLKKRRPAAERFSFVSPEEVELNKDKVVPPNTKKSTTWALKLFNEWCDARAKAAGNYIRSRNAMQIAVMQRKYVYFEEYGVY